MKDLRDLKGMMIHDIKATSDEEYTTGTHPSYIRGEVCRLFFSIMRCVKQARFVDRVCFQ